MARLGWILMAVGLTVAAGFAARLAWFTIFEPETNIAMGGFVLTFGLWIGLITAAVGAVTVAKTRGVKTPPL
jgi:hypothetical protein